MKKSSNSFLSVSSKIRSINDESLESKCYCDDDDHDAHALNVLIIN